MIYFDATDTLRKQLDERGVEWREQERTYTRTTYWKGADGRPAEYMEEKRVFPRDPRKDGELRFSCAPEWAIAATLGGGTLTADDVLNAVYNHGARWQAIADELNATLASKFSERMAKLDELRGEAR